jgi:hypothetical protein
MAANECERVHEQSGQSEPSQTEVQGLRLRFGVGKPLTAIHLALLYVLQAFPVIDAK